MSLASACLWTFVRTVVLCLVAWPICVLVERRIRLVSDQGRAVWFGLLLAPCLFPELLVGYTYRDTALASTRLAEWICFGLLLIRIVPVGVVTLLASPRSLAGSASTYCRWLLLRANPQSFLEICRVIQCVWHGPIRRAFPALGLMSILAFQEFELAALLQTASWTDWFIAAQRVGLDRSEMLTQSLWPIVIQFPLLAGVLFWTVRQRDRRTEVSEDSGYQDRVGWEGPVYLGVAMIFGCVVPLSFMASNLFSGLRMIVRQPTQLSGLIQEISIASAVSICTGLTTWSASRWFLDSTRLVTPSPWIRQWLLMPGLAGSLLLSLAAGVLFQQTWLRPFYDTPLPWVLALIVWLLPRAVLIRLWLETMTRTEGLHLAELLMARRTGQHEPAAQKKDVTATCTDMPADSLGPATLLFRLRDQPRILAMGLLCYWAYLDLSTAYLLAPSGMPSGLVRLYNFMHFGRSSALSAEAFLFFGVPLATIAGALVVSRFLRRRTMTGRF